MKTMRFFRLFAGLFLFLSLVLSPAANPAQADPLPGQPLVAGDELWASNFMLGANNDIDAVAIHGNDLYVGGDFTAIGGIAARQIAHYNLVTHQWNALGGGVNNRVYAIASNGRYVYVGGYFNQAGSLSVSALAVWDTVTQTWSKVGNADLTDGVYSPTVKALAFDNLGRLIVGGAFLTIGSLTTPNIARFNGGVSWSALGSGLGDGNSEVDGLAVSGADFYAGGTFLAPYYGVAQWNGSSWSGLGSGLIHSFYKDVSAVTVSGSNVYIGGSFDTVTGSGGDVAVSNIAVWNGLHWAGLGTGIDAGVYTLGVDASGNLYAGGQYNTAGGTTTNKIAVWNGATWAALKSPTSFNAGVSSNVYSLVVSGNNVYVGGDMITAGDFTANYLARWNLVDKNWFSLAGGADEPVSAVAVNGNDVYVGGTFESAGGVAANSIAHWNTLSRTWSALGAGMFGCSVFLCIYPVVTSILAVGADVYVGGDFISAGGLSVNGIARWNTRDKLWHSLGTGLNCTGLLCYFEVSSMVYDGTCLIVGGTFSSAGGVAASNLAQWCGSSWSNVVWNDGTDHIVQTNKSVNALALDPYGVLYVGGAFTAPTHYAFWTDYRDGVFPISADNLNGAVNAIALQGSTIYIGGAFTNASGVTHADYVAKLTGGSIHWSALGSGFDGIVNALALQGTVLFAGGDFLNSGAIGVAHVAKFNGPAWGPLGGGTDGNVAALAADSNFIYAGGQFQSAGNKPASNFSLWGHYHGLMPRMRK